ncbi:hypothetical protein CTA2_1761 [Colletotrichum tanaceti]|uniref:Uncharacterized protein n=1 Tax=Colletotrichum tanaceti TaxID=1306861 RepID=A0A4V6Y9I3_9PEZI|nr:hypothetical protein CTA2_1761 [Colletotrichum tanaceti]TKW56106.1 hypothetical protein CTA1_8255 [Colletotrichum tanaceti]
MDSDEPALITHPSQMEEFGLAIRLANLSVETSDPRSPSLPVTRHIKLALLQPLAAPAMLAACRNPSSALASMTISSSNGTSSTAPGIEYLDLGVLDKAWRKAVGPVLPVSFITFDLSLPQPSPGSEAEQGDGSFRRVYWERSPPRDVKALCIAMRDVFRLVNTIATTARMRTREDLGFDVVYTETTDITPWNAIGLLRRNLQAIAEARRPGESSG